MSGRSIKRCTQCHTKSYRNLTLRLMMCQARIRVGHVPSTTGTDQGLPITLDYQSVGHTSCTLRELWSEQKKQHAYS